MGLDITAYTELEKIDPAILEEIKSDDDPESEAYDRGYRSFHSDSDFIERAAGVEIGIFYKAKEKFGFRAGSYGGYNTWRQMLAESVGINNLLAFWDKPDVRKPFYELINFSDCEGTIGPVVSAKLADDFEKQEKIVKTFIQASKYNAEEQDYFLSKYKEWKKAFTLAADGGAVAFH